MIYTLTLNPAIDRLLYIEERLQKKKTNRISRVAYDLGGKGLHGSHVLTTLGIDNEAIALVGAQNEKKLTALVEAKAIKHQFISLPDQRTRETYVIIEKKISGSHMLTETGFRVTQEVVAQLLEIVDQRIRGQDLVLIAGSFPKNYGLAQFKELVLLLKEKGCFIACDLSGAALKMAVDLEVNFIKPNEFELAELTGTVLSVDLVEQLRQLALKVDYVVASQGAQGSFCAHGEKVYQTVPPLVKEVNDTGAGDCFVGAFIGGLAKEHSLLDNLVFATACAASKVQYSDSTTFSYQEALALQAQVRVAEIS